MANKNASIGITLSYVDANGVTRTEALTSITAPYLASEPGQILDVPSGATAGDSYAVAFGTVGVEASAVLIKNGCSAPITVRLNGITAAGSGDPIAAGGAMLIANPTTASGTTGAGPVVSAVCYLTSTQTGGAGQIAAWVFGDPS